MKKCGYSFWGYLGDVKYDERGNVVSTPDGNAFYSWCIIRELQKRGYRVTQIMPDRDRKGHELDGDALFSSWLEWERAQAYAETENIFWVLDPVIEELAYKNSIYEIVRRVKGIVTWVLEGICEDMEFILHEYRMLIPGRNDFDSILEESWQPDYLIQECLFEYCCEHRKRLILFDLDYKLEFKTYKELREAGCPAIIFELGNKWERTAHDITNGVEARHVYIPFDFDYINYFSYNHSTKRKYDLVYVGNRYERDWCIDKYIPSNLDKCTVYGNWLEGDRDSCDRWPYIKFGKRLQTGDMPGVYRNYVATILLAKKEYCEYGFMTARILEAIFYGTVPLFIEEYGEEIIKAFAGEYAELLTVRSSSDVWTRIQVLRDVNDGSGINIIIEYLRERLKFMDVRYFVDAIEEVI